MNSQIPIVLVTGFLGGGKTTLLKSLARRHRHRHLVFVVNEFSRIDIDTPLLQQDAVEVVSIAGGSIFCRCLVAEFVRNMREIAAQSQRSGVPIDAVVIEASGIANPAVAKQMLAETHLDKEFTLARVVTVIDPGSFFKLLRTLPNIVAQVQTADLLLINKVDLFAETLLCELEEQLRAFNPTAIQERIQHGESRLELLAGVTGAHPPGEYAACADPRFAVITLPDLVNVNMPLLRSLVADLGDDLYRLKGYARCDGRIVFVDGSASGLSCKEVDGEHSTPLVLIVSPNGERRARAAISGYCNAV